METQDLKGKKLDWVRNLRVGDPAACEEFAQGVRPMVLSCCRHLGLTADAAEDVTGETYLSVLKGLSSFKDRARVSSWIWTIAYRQTVNHIRRCGRERRIPPPGENHEPDATEPGQLAEARELQQRLHWAVEQLPESWAQAIRLYYWQSQSTREIAQTMQVRDGVVRAYLFRGRNRLRTLLLAG